MRIEPRSLIAPLLAVVVMALTLRQIMSALKSSDVWQTRPRINRVRPEDPFARLDNLLGARIPEVPYDRIRDPFSYVSARPVTVVTGHPQPGPRPQPVVVPPAPVLTSIVWDNDPRATIRYLDKEFSVRENSLFADFTVRSITSSQVVLERNGQEMVLTLRSKGD
jgi:hypothetical protein